MSQQPIFKHGEAEALVNDLRHHLRESHRLDTEGQATAGQVALGRGYDVRDQLLNRLSKRFWNEAVAGLHGYSHEDHEDATVLMMENVAADLMNLNSSRTALAYEKWFNGIVDKRIRNALRTIRRREERQSGEILSLDDPISDDEESETRGSVVGDWRSLAELEVIFDAEILSDFRNQLTHDQLQLVGIRLKFPDASVSQLARLIRVPERTARNRLNNAKALLIDIVQGKR